MENLKQAKSFCFFLKKFILNGLSGTEMAVLKRTNLPMRKPYVAWVSTFKVIQIESKIGLSRFIFRPPYHWCAAAICKLVIGCCIHMAAVKITRATNGWHRSQTPIMKMGSRLFFNNEGNLPPSHNNILETAYPWVERAECHSPTRAKVQFYSLGVDLVPT